MSFMPLPLDCLHQILTALHLNMLPARQGGPTRQMASVTGGRADLQCGDWVVNPISGKRYQLDRRLGSGGFGSAWAARREGDDSAVYALKISAANKDAFQSVKVGT